MRSPKQTDEQQKSSEKKVLCNLCADVGWIRKEKGVYEEGFGQMDRCRCKQAEDARSLQEKIGTEIEDVSLDSLINRGPGSKAMIEALKNFIVSPESYGGLTIWGKNGNGKTTALMAAINYCLSQDIAAVYMTASEFTQYLKDGIGLVFSDEDRLRQISSIPVLALDELTAVRNTDYNTDKIERLIDNRYRVKNTTLIAMDEPPSAKLHPRLISRLQQGTIVKNNDSDLRPALAGKER